jgi:hypothetical protein
MKAFNPAKPDRGQAFSATQYDNLSDEELRKLLNACKVRVQPQQRPVAPKYVDIDALVKSDD